MRLFLFLLLLPWLIAAQTINWTDITSNYSLPQGVQLYKGVRNVSPKLKVWYLNVDLNQPDIAIRPYLRSNSTGLSTFTPAVGAYAAVNGGYFGGNTSYSAVVYPGELKAQNVSVLNRSGTTYYATRSFFGITFDGEMSVDWIWHFDATLDGLFTFVNPNPNSQGSPAPPPLMSAGNVYDSLMVGIGGGPTLVKNGQIQISYEEEVFFGSGVSLNTRDPRTAVGYTADDHVIMLVADGRQTASEGFTLPELAQVMIDLGCIEAMNLDGGGSSQMAVDDQLINLPEGGTYERPVPAILAVVHKDSLNVPREPQLEKTYDTEDGSCSFNGIWPNSANSGYWANTPARICSRGNGENTATFALDVPVPSDYSLYAWWVASFNRCKDTPFIVHHYHGIDTVKLDQSVNGSQWVLVGDYTLTGDAAEKVIITNGATTGDYVVADGLKIVSFDTTQASGISDKDTEIPAHFELYQNYPNPFNSSTVIEYSVAANNYSPHLLILTIYNSMGQKIETLVSAYQKPGIYQYKWDATGLASGVYYYRLQAGTEFIQTRKLVLMK